MTSTPENNPTSFYQRATAFVIKHRKLIYGLISFIVLIVISLGLFLYYKEAEERKQIAELYKVEKFLARQISDDIDKEEEGQIENAKTLAEQFIQKHKTSNQVNLAQYYLANYYLYKDDYDSAQELLENIPADEEQHTLDVLIKLNLATIHQKKKKLPISY